MRHKKVFIAIVILLVLGLGLFSEYRRRTGDCDFTIPSRISLSSRSDLSPYWDSFMAMSKRWVVCEDFECGLTAYSIQNQTRTKVSEFIFDYRVAMDEPWIVWADPNGVSAFDLRDSRHYQLSENWLWNDAPAIDGTIAVWMDEGNLVGYNLETKTRLTIASGSNISDGKDESGNPFVLMASANRQYPDICGDIVVWTEEHSFESPPFMVLGYNLRSREKYVVRESTCEILCPRISGHYIVWKEEEPDKPNERLFTLMAYDLRNKALMRVCMGIESDFDVDISGDIVVWDHYRDKSGSDIFGHNLSTGKTFCICSFRYSQYAPKISGHTVIWCDGRPQGWLAKLLKKEPSTIRGKIFRHWPGEEGGGDD